MEDDDGGLQPLEVGGASTDLCKPLQSMGKIGESNVDFKQWNCKNIIFDEANCDAVLPGKGREWINSVEKIGCKQLKWRCPLESEGLEDDSDKVEHAAQEAECAALKLIVEATGKVP